MASDIDIKGALKAGDKVGSRFEIVKTLGRGGFAITYMARAGRYKKAYAIKEFLPLTLAVREQDGVVHPVSRSEHELYELGLKDFISEGQRLLECRHSSIVQVEDFIEERGTAYLVMEYIDGITLQDYLEKHGPLSGEQLVKLLLPLLDALKLLHGKNLLHRDLSPANIMLRDGKMDPVLIDFGAARQTEAIRSHLRTLSISHVYSEGYSPPEQYLGKSGQGFYSDIYALGCVAYRALTGKRPPSAADRMKANDPMQGWGGRFPKLDAKLLVRAIDGATAIEPSERFQSVDEFRDQLKQVQTLWSQIKTLASNESMRHMSVVEHEDGVLELKGSISSQEAAESIVSILHAAAPDISIAADFSLGTGAPTKRDSAKPAAQQDVVTQIHEAREVLATEHADWAGIATVGPIEDGKTAVVVSGNPPNKSSLTKLTQKLEQRFPETTIYHDSKLPRPTASRPSRTKTVPSRQDEPSTGARPSGRSEQVSPNRGRRFLPIAAAIAGISVLVMGSVAQFMGTETDETDNPVSGSPQASAPPSQQQPANTEKPAASTVTSTTPGTKAPVETKPKVVAKPVEKDVSKDASAGGANTATAETKPSGAVSGVLTEQAKPPVEVASLNPLECGIEVPKEVYKIGDVLTFTVSANRDSRFLLYSIDPANKVQLFDPELHPKLFGKATLTAGEVRRIPVPEANIPGKGGRVRIEGPPGTSTIGVLCGAQDFKQLGLTSAHLSVAASSGRETFEEFLLNKTKNGNLEPSSRQLTMKKKTYEILP